MINGADDARVACPLFQAEYGGSKPTSALQLRIVKVSLALACRLNALWHSRLPQIPAHGVRFQGHVLCFAAECSNVYYAAAIWSSPIAANRLKNGWMALELRRLACAPDAPKNTASRMLSIMRKLVAKEFPHIQRLISYQDTEVHTGTIYKAAGWQKVMKQTHFIQWRARPGSPVNVAQSTAPKIRWEYEL